MIIDPLYEDMFSFGSQINDILDKPSFTLEELLKEDDLLQEVKSMNHRLLDFLSQESTVSSLVDNIVQPALETDSELRKFKYPYMSCEVICLEVPEILNTLVNLNEGQYVIKLFSLLNTTSSSLDNYLAGYFEKILEMLFRKTEEIMKIINSQGIELFKKILHHIDNYSIMQLVQRLMLPHIPTLVTNDNNSSTINLSSKDNEPIPENPTVVCEWSLNEEYINLICQRMLEVNNEEISAHISDLLITVVQLSPSDSLVISNLCTNSCLEGVLKSAFNIPFTTTTATSSSSSSSTEAQSDNNKDHIANTTSSSSSSPLLLSSSSLSTSSESISLASISVLESLISRLSEPPETTEQTSPDELDKLLAISNACIDNVFINITDYFPIIFDQLKSLMEVHESSKNHGFKQNKIDDGNNMNDSNDSYSHNNSEEKNDSSSGDSGGSSGASKSKNSNKKKSKKTSIMIDENGEIVADPTDENADDVEEDNDESNNIDDIKQLASATQFKFQSKVYYPRLGNRGLQLVKLVESLVRLNLLEVDKRLCETGIFSILLDLFFYFSQNSLLHLSIQRLILTIIEGGDYRKFTQQHILIDSRLIERIMDYLSQDSNKEIPVLAGLKSPLLGHVIVMGQSIFNIMQEHADRMNNEVAFTTTASTVDSAATTDTTATAAVTIAMESTNAENENDDGWGSSSNNDNDHYSSNTFTAIASAFPDSLTGPPSTSTATTNSDNTATAIDSTDSAAVTATTTDHLHIIDIGFDINELSLETNKLTENQSDTNKIVSDQTDIFGVGKTDCAKNTKSSSNTSPRSGGRHMVAVRPVVDMNNDYGVGYEVSADDNLEDDPNALVNIDVGGVGNNAYDKAIFDKKHHHQTPGSPTGSGKNDSSKTILSEKSQSPGVAISSVPQILSAHQLIERWENFSNQILNKYLEKQFVNQQLGNSNMNDSMMLSNHAGGGFGNNGLTDNNTSMSMYNGNNSNAFSSSDEFNDNFYKDDDDDDDDDEIFGKYSHNDDDSHITHFSSFHQLSHSNNAHKNPHGSGSSYIGEGQDEGDDSENGSFSFSSFNNNNDDSNNNSTFDPFGATQSDLSAFADFSAFTTALQSQQSISAHRYGVEGEEEDDEEDEHHDETGSDDSGDVTNGKQQSSGGSNRSSSKSSGSGGSSGKSNGGGSGKIYDSSSINDRLAQLSSSTSSAFDFDPFGDSSSAIDAIAGITSTGISTSATTSNAVANDGNTDTNGDGIDLSNIEAVFDFDPFSSEDSTNMIINPDHSDIIAAATAAANTSYNATAANTTSSISSSTSGTEVVGDRDITIATNGAVDSFGADFSTTNSFSADKDNVKDLSAANDADTTINNNTGSAEVIVGNEDSISS